MLLFSRRTDQVSYSCPASSNRVIRFLLQSRGSTTIMKDVHESSRRFGRQHILSHLRQQFWLIKANSTMRKTLNNCAFCRKQFGQLNKQKMADLCEDRLLSDKSPFTIVGLDCFGPFIVKQNRTILKHYGVIFTCLTCLAVHIEVFYSMDSSSF